MTLVKLNIGLSREEHNLFSYLGEVASIHKRLTEVITDHANVTPLDKLEGDTLVTLEVEIPIKLAVELEEKAKQKNMTLSEYTRSVVATYAKLQTEINKLREQERVELVRTRKGVPVRFEVTGELFEKYEKVFGRTKSMNHADTEANKKHTLIALEKGLDVLIKEKQ